MPGQRVAALLSAPRHDLTFARHAFASSKLVQDVERALNQGAVAGWDAGLGQTGRQ